MRVTVRHRASGLFLLVGLLAIGAFYLIPDDTARAVIQQGLGAASVIAVITGIRWYRPDAERGWLLVAGAYGLLVFGDLVYDVVWLTVGDPDGTSIADVFYVAAYPVLAAGVAVMARTQHRGRDRDGLIDGTILALSATFLAWQAIAAPALADGSTSIVDQVTANAYLLGDIIVLVVVARLSFRVDDRIPAYWLFLGSIGVILLGDVVYDIQGDAYVFPSWVDATWMLGYVLVASAALHPSMRALTTPTEESPSRLTRTRLALLAASLVAAPLIGILYATDQDEGTPWFLLVTYATIVALVLGRIVRLTRDVEHAHASVTKREDRFRALVQNTTDVIAVLSPGGRITYISPAIERVLGYTTAQMEGRSSAAFVHPDDLAGLIETMEHLRSEPGATRWVDFRHRAADGSWRWTEASMTNLLDHPAVRGVVVNERDITDRRRAEGALRARMQQQEAVAHLGRRALEGADPDALAAEAVEMVVATLDVCGCHFFRRTDGATLAFAAGFVPEHTRWAPSVAPADKGSLAAYTVAVGETVISRDLRSEARFTVSDALLASGISSAMSVLVTGRDQPNGALSVYATRTDALTAEDASFLQSMANGLSLALDRRRADDEIRHQALHDSLTGLPNRVLFLDRLQLALGRCERQETTAAVLFLDLDHFKVVNDSLGHDAGDHLLGMVAQRIRAAIRPGDTVARIGGDEFTVLCEDLENEGQARSVAARVELAMEAPFDVAGNHLHVSISIGIALARPAQDRPDRLLRDADAAMYRAKELGRARVEVFDTTMHDSAMLRLRTENDLRDALLHEGLRLDYQPIFDLRDGRLLGLEALARWQHGVRGLLLPDQFVPIAEESGLIDMLGQWALAEACRQVAAWSADGIADDVTVAVNLSTRQLTRGDLAGNLGAILADTGVRADRLCLEITESVLLSDLETTMSALRSLKDLGVQIAIDDFGTGYSSLNYVKQLPVDILKVDRSFVEGLTDNPEDAAIAATVITLAHSLGLTAIAEGVETHAQLDEITALGCDQAQGFLMARPVPADRIDFTATLFTAAAETLDLTDPVHGTVRR